MDKKNIPGTTEDHNWARLDTLASEVGVTDMPQLLSFVLFKPDEGAFSGKAVRHTVLGELDSHGAFVVHLGAPWRDQFYRSQEEADEAGRPRLVVRAGEGAPPRHMRIAPEQFAALAHHMGPGGGRLWVPFLDEAADGTTAGINWRNKETGQVLVDVPPPVV